MSSPSLPDHSAYLAQPSDAERELRRIYRPSAPLVIFDIGACEGEDSVRYARLFPRARVFTFEPLPSNQELVRAAFARHQVTNAELVPVALSDREGTAEFHVSSGEPSTKFAGENWNYGNKSSSLLPPAEATPMYGWIEFKQKITVPTTTLDRFCLDRGVAAIDFIHMDVQGAEHLVLAGARAMLANVGCCWFEVSDRELYKGQKLRTEMEQLMQDHGFVKTLEVRREIEGDQFYVNRRSARFWAYRSAKQLERIYRGSRRRLAAIRTSLTRRT